MIASAVLALRLVVEIALGCHCAGWTLTEFGARCTSPLERPRCEFVSGWHPISYGVNTCSRACKEYSDG